MLIMLKLSAKQGIFMNHSHAFEKQTGRLKP